jgi:DNA-binding response OmpR family regulator
MSKILIVEDELEIAELEKDYLEMEGHEVTIEGDGRKGLEKILSKEFDLVLLDIMLPNLSGLEICKEARKNVNIPIIMVSARKEETDKVKGLECGADDYITKSFSPSELVARVKAHLQRYDRLVSGNLDNDIIEVKGLRIDKTAHRVFVDGEEKIFTNKEFDLLTFLAQNPNRVFTKEELFKTIWEMDPSGDIATVTVHIKKIREKVENDSQNPDYIETIWGKGYRFKAQR